MPTIGEMSGIPRRELHVFYILDTSGSMEGLRIATLNRAMQETIDVLKEEAHSNADAKLKIAVLEFNTTPRWLNAAGPEDMEDFIYEDLKPGGLTEVGAALEELGSKLSREKFLKSMTGAYLPVLIFMTDGYATDEYEDALKRLNANRWFSRGIKIGFAIGSDADQEMIAKIVGNPEAVVQTDELEVFARLLKWVSVTASMMCSRTRTSVDSITGRDVISQLARDGTIPAGVVNTKIVMPAVPDTDAEDAWDDGDIFEDSAFD